MRKLFFKQKLLKSQNSFNRYYFPDVFDESEFVIKNMLAK